MRTLAVLAAVLVFAPGAAAQEPQSAGATDWFGRGIVRVRQEGTEVQLDLKTESQGMLLRLAEGQPITIVAIGPFAAGTSTVRIPPEPPPQRVRVTTGRPPSDAEEGVAETAEIRQQAQCMAAQAERTRVPPASGSDPQARTRMPPANSPNYDPSVCVTTQRVSQGRSWQFLRAPPREYLLLVLSDRPIDSTVTSRIGTIPGFDPATAAHDFAEFLVGRRSPMWAGYLVRH